MNRHKGDNMKEGTVHKTALAVYGIPPVYADISWDSLELSKAEVERISSAFENPHMGSTVFIQGTAAPIVIQLIKQGYTVAGINLMERNLDAFGEHNNPKAQVILIHSIEKYTGKYEIASNMLSNLIKHYEGHNSLILLQSQETWTFLRDNYGINVINKLKLVQKKATAWV